MSKTAYKTGYKVVWRDFNRSHAESIGGDLLDAAARCYRAGEPVEPAAGAGPLHVFADAWSALSMASNLARYWPKVGQFEVWEIDWLPWAGKLPRGQREKNRFNEPATLAGWSSPDLRREYVRTGGLPRKTRLARRVVLRRLKAKLCKVAVGQVVWEIV